MLKRCVLALLALILLAAAPARAEESTAGEVLNEVPFHPVPAEMTLQEYRDANRRLGVGLMLATIPIPGMLQFYADEPRSGWKHVGTAGLGLVSVVLGAALMDETDAWPESDYEVVDITGENGTVKRYEKIPIGIETGSTHYKLRALERESEGGGALLVALGAGLIVGQWVHGWIDGIRTIERKRDAVRYRYGQSLSLQPQLDATRERVGLQLALRF